VQFCSAFTSTFMWNCTAAAFLLENAHPFSKRRRLVHIRSSFCLSTPVPSLLLLYLTGTCNILCGCTQTMSPFRFYLRLCLRFFASSLMWTCTILCSCAKTISQSGREGVVAHSGGHRSESPRLQGSVCEGHPQEWCRARFSSIERKLL
jgi:hypothetical protein